MKPPQSETALIKCGPAGGLIRLATQNSSIPSGANRPVRVAARIGIRHVHRVPDDRAGGITNVLGIERIDGQPVDPPADRGFGLGDLAVIHARPRHIGALDESRWDFGLMSVQVWPPLVVR